MPRPSTITSNDRDVLGVLAGAHRPLSAYDILAAVKSKGLKAPTQVYRALEKLGREGLVHRIEALNAFVACTNAHHGRPGFAICRDCGQVREFDTPAVELLAQAAVARGFVIEAINLEIYGHCSPCLAKHGGAT